MNRRTFNKLISSATLGSVTPGLNGTASASPASFTDDGVKFSTKWPDQVYRRLLVDMHIPDWDPSS